MDLWEEVWPFSPYVLKGNWRTKLAKNEEKGRGCSFPDVTKLADRPVEMVAPTVERRKTAVEKCQATPGLRDGSPRSSRATSGCLSVVEAGWQIAGGGGGR